MTTIPVPSAPPKVEVVETGVRTMVHNAGELVTFVQAQRSRSEPDRGESWTGDNAAGDGKKTENREVRADDERAEQHATALRPRRLGSGAGISEEPGRGGAAARVQLVRLPAGGPLRRAST